MIEGIQGLFDHPGVSYVIRGAGDAPSTTIAVTFTDEAIDSLADRLDCAPTSQSIIAKIVSGLVDVFSPAEVRVKSIYQREADQCLK